MDIWQWPCILLKYNYKPGVCLERSFVRSLRLWFGKSNLVAVPSILRSVWNANYLPLKASNSQHIPTNDLFYTLVFTEKCKESFVRLDYRVFKTKIVSILCLCL